MNELSVGGERLIPGEMACAKFLPAKPLCGQPSINGGLHQKMSTILHIAISGISQFHRIFIYLLCFKTPVVGSHLFLPLSMALCTISEVHLSDHAGPVKHCMISESDVRAS